MEHQHNKDKINDYRRNRRKTNTTVMIRDNLRRRVNKALSHNIKSKHTLELLGCSLDELKVHLQETAIKNGYKDFNINDYSGDDYHIDHIRPCSFYDLSKSEEQSECFHYTNMQILSASKNEQKGDRYES
jgi:hypothetical protein